MPVSVSAFTSGNQRAWTGEHPVRRVGSDKPRDGPDGDGKTKRSSCQGLWLTTAMASFSQLVFSATTHPARASPAAEMLVAPASCA